MELTKQVSAYQLDRVMVVDDSMPDRFIADKIIKRSGVASSVSLHESAREALDALLRMREKHEVPAVIFLDIRMPDMDGFEFLDQFSTLPEVVREKTNVVMLSSSSYVDDKKRAEAHDCVKGFLSKPLTEKLLLGQCELLQDKKAL